MSKFIYTLIVLSISAPVSSAEYNGVTLDGNSYSCTAYSYDTSQYYDVTAEFDGSDVSITFSNGESRTLSIDDEEIDDPSDISAYDYENSVYWDLDCSDDIN